mmetsp:Transcript_30322/g.51886  ORF Transcript_30322/g.51886 Transcript_30322/m.51886 type:complete len:93 (+) Transcript_30322:802-1080(+)
MRAAAIRTGVNVMELKSWGQLVKDAFVTANAQNFSNCGGTESEQLSAALTVLQSPLCKHLRISMLCPHSLRKCRPSKLKQMELSRLWYRQMR